MKDIKLYIGATEVDLADGENILYNYEVKDLTNPTAVLNSFSKSLTLPNTPTNSRVFGHYWQVERTVGNGGQNAGVDFNASKKAPFQVFVNGELYEEGYVKLDQIVRTGTDIKYSISLFGGLGDWLYSLSQNPNTGDELRLSDLDYYTGGADEFDFTVSATTVYDAWEALRNGTNGKWQHINFMPAYNGYPDDFDADKVIINLSGTSLQRTDDTGYFGPRDGCVIASLPQEMTEWEMRDLRSYHQRPCIRMKSVINACCDPNQNGGYSVILDTDFFNDSNPYWNKTWLSLPMVKNLEYSNEEQILSGSTLIGLPTTGATSGMMYQDLKFDIGDYSNSTPSNISIDARFFVNNIFHNPDTPLDPIHEGLRNIDCPYTSLAWFWNRNGDSYHTGWWCLGSLYVQLIAMNGDVVVGASDAYNLTSPIRHNGKLYFGCNQYYSEENKFKAYLGKSIYDVLGEFHDDGFHREGENSPATLNMTIRNLNSPVNQLKVVWYWGATNDKIKHYGRETLFDETQESSWIDIGGPDPATYTIGEPWPLTVGITRTNFQAVLGDSLGRSGSKVTKSLLLNSEGTPASYLLSYCKTFGLYIIKDSDSNTIRIETRKTFYHRDEIVDLSQLIDRSQEITIDPLAFSTKWYQLVHEQDETENYNKYFSSRGVPYGCKVLNTGFEFSTEKKDLLEDSIIRGGIEVLERSKYFTAYNNDRVQRNWMGMGLTYDLYFGTSGKTINVSTTNNSSLLGLNEGDGMKYYDVIPKLQFHSEDNEATDGNNVLVFFSGFKDVQSGRTNPLYYYLSDDNRWQTLLNDSTPCWLFTPSEQIGGINVAKRVRYIPVFERYLTNASSGKVNKSLDFGTAQELFIPDYSITEDSNIYSNFWASYLTDLFDPDTKVLTCFVRTTEKVGTAWLKKFFWFDNALWVCNKVDEYDFLSEGTTKMEFIKVQDVSDYNSVTQTNPAVVTITPNKYVIEQGEGVVTLAVTISNGGSWRLSSSPEGVVLSSTSGSGNGSVTATIPANNGSDFKSWHFTVSSLDGDATAKATVRQRYNGDINFRPTPVRILVPASGGSIIVDFDWLNQGDDYVSGYTTIGNTVFSADLTTYKDENKAILTFSANTSPSSLHSSIDFSSNDGMINTVGIDQLPALEEFSSSGGQDTIIFQYSTGATFINTPDWVNITDNGGGNYEISVRDNLYNVGNSAVITVTNTDGSSAPLPISQEAGDGTGGKCSCTPEGVSPLNLYYDPVGGMKFISVSLEGGWTATTSGGFFTISQDTGDEGLNIIGVTVTANTGTTRTGTITISNGLDTYVVTITQIGENTPETLIVSPSTASIASSGGLQTIDIQYEGRNGYIINPIVTSPASATPITWTGESGTTLVIIPENTTTSSRTFSVVFNGRNDSATTVITQAAAAAYAVIGSTGNTFPASGGSGNNNITSNTDWHASASTSWITVTPSSGSGGYTDIVISTSANTTTTARTGYVYILDGDDNILATITVEQGGVEELLSVNPSIITFDSTGGTATFTITSNTNWTIE